MRSGFLDIYRDQPVQAHLQKPVSDYATNQASGIVLFEDYFRVARLPESMPRADITPYEPTYQDLGIASFPFQT